MLRIFDSKLDVIKIYTCLVINLIENEKYETPHYLHHN